MSGFFVTIIVGIICIALGISNMKGNISSIHSYHRHRVSEEDRLPFGRLVGIGTIIIGIGVIISGALSMVAIALERNIYTFIGIGIMVVCIVVGLAISFWGMIKYNKGIF